VRLLTSGASPISPDVFDFLRICFGATGAHVLRCMSAHSRAGLLCMPCPAARLQAWLGSNLAVGYLTPEGRQLTMLTASPHFPVAVIPPPSSGGVRHDRDELPHQHDSSWGPAGGACGPPLTRVRGEPHPPAASAAQLLPPSALTLPALFTRGSAAVQLRCTSHHPAAVTARPALDCVLCTLWSPAQVKLEDLPEMGYTNADQPHPRGEVRLASGCVHGASTRQDARVGGV
jgi:hypothetical protein